MFTLTALALACSAASAQQTASVAVTGNITPSGCTASLSNKGKFDLGVFYENSLSSSDSTNVVTDGTKATFNILCPAAAQVAWRIKDNRPASQYGPSSDAWFGLGTDDDGHQIGAYALWMSRPTLDGGAAYVLESTDNGSNWSPIRIANIKDSRLYTYSKTGKGPDKGSSFNVDINLLARIAPTSQLNTSSVTDMDGSATISFVYL